MSMLLAFNGSYILYIGWNQLDSCFVITFSRGLRALDLTRRDCEIAVMVCSPTKQLSCFFFPFQRRLAVAFLSLPTLSNWGRMLLFEARVLVRHRKLHLCHMLWSEVRFPFLLREDHALTFHACMCLGEAICLLNRLPCHRRNLLVSQTMHKWLQCNHLSNLLHD